MTNRTRGLFAGISSIIFLTAAPLVIGYSVGHRIDKSITNPIAVGTIILRTFPTGATVTLNDGERQRTSPGAFASLVAGMHTVRIQKDGYRAWEKQIRVEGTRITDVRHVRLIPEQVEEELVRRDISDFTISPNGNLLVAAENTETNKRLITTLVEGVEERDEWDDTDLIFSNDVELGFLWNPDNSRVLVTAQGLEKQLFAILDTSNGTFIALNDVDDVLGWVPGDLGRIVVRRGSSLFHERPKEEISRVEIASNVHQAALYASGIIAEITTDEENKLYRIPDATGSQEEIVTPPLEGSSIRKIAPSSYNDIAILTEPNDSLLLWDEQNRVWRAVADSVLDIWWSPDGEKVMWQETEFDIYAMNIRERRNSLSPFVPELITRNSSSIIKPTWFAGSQHILYRVEGDLHIIETDPRDGHRSEKLLESHIPRADSRVVEEGQVIFTTAIRQDGPVLLRIFLYTEEDR